MVGLLADPAIVEYIGVGGASNLPGKTGLLLGGGWTLLRWQAEAAVWVIVYTAVATFIILKLVGIFIPLRLTDEELEIGDHAIHGNEVYPSDVPTLGGPHAAGVAARPSAKPGGRLVRSDNWRHGCLRFQLNPNPLPAAPLRRGRCFVS